MQSSRCSSVSIASLVLLLVLSPTRVRVVLGSRSCCLLHLERHHQLASPSHAATPLLLLQCQWQCTAAESSRAVNVETN